MRPEDIRSPSYFRRQLIFRLVLVGLAASLLAGAALFVIESGWIERVCANLAALEARNFARVLVADTDGPARDAALRAAIHQSLASSRGGFVQVEIRHGPAGAVIARAAAPPFAEAIGRFERCEGQHSQFGADRCNRQLIGDSVFVRFDEPILDGDGRELGRFAGLFRVAPQTLQAIRLDNVTLFAITIGAVLLTALALYPLLAALQGRVVAEARHLLRANLDTLKLLGSAVAKRDYGTRTHNFRVTLYAVRLAEALGLAPAAIRSLIKGALLHDVGKIAVRDAVLLKPGKLDPAEFEEMKGHVAHGLDIIAASTWLRDAATVVGGHHEWLDGSGYPHGAAGSEVPLAARIFAIVDVFDALTSVRPYKPALPLDAALALLEQGRGSHFDPELLGRFAAIAPELHRTLSQSDEAGIEAMTDRVLAHYFRLAAE
ncbi:HD-GYP domain-containing protein [Phaeospirillum tilakii]|uniref:HD-GYP domain-containing protein n=1 Tax=Phaeospirillum tilakii TaxID=741673 RepID=A0ABW5C9A8_9PROT